MQGKGPQKPGLGTTVLGQEFQNIHAFDMFWHNHCIDRLRVCVQVKETGWNYPSAAHRNTVQMCAKSIKYGINR